MNYLGIPLEKPKVGVFGFTGCEGCQLQIANKEETLAALLGALERSRRLMAIAGACLVVLACIIVFVKPVQLPSLKTFWHGSSSTTTVSAVASPGTNVPSTSTQTTVPPPNSTTTGIPPTTLLPTTAPSVTTSPSVGASSTTEAVPASQYENRWRTFV